MIALGGLDTEIAVASLTAKSIVRRQGFQQSRFAGPVFPGEEANSRSKC